MYSLLAASKIAIYVIAGIVGVIVFSVILHFINREFRIRYRLNLIGGGLLMLIAIGAAVGGVLIVTKAGSKIGYALFAEVLRENAYLARTVAVQEDQRVIDTGLYGVVRHPMYLSTLILFLAMPLVLGSVISFVIMLAYFPIIARRIRNEEQVLEHGLDGYTEYKKRVRYKVIPHIW